MRYPRERGGKPPENRQANCRRSTTLPARANRDYDSIAGRNDGFPGACRLSPAAAALVVFGPAVAASAQEEPPANPPPGTR